MRRCHALALFGLAVIAAAARAEEPSPLTLCLAPAADDSAVYPLQEVPASNRELVVVFQLRAGESFGKLEHVWTAVDVGDAAPANTEVGREETALNGMTRGNLKFTLPRDLPVGKYRLDVSADGKPWASLEFPVVPAKETTPLAKPADLMPLEPGTKWTYAWVLEPGPTIKKLNVSGAAQGADGKCRATMAVTVSGKEEGLAHVEMKRGDTLVSEEWWSLTDKGLVVARVKIEGEMADYDPPLPMIALPLESASSWTHQPKDGPPVEYRMWGPLPVRTPSGEAPGWIVWMRFVAGDQITTIERHYAPGVGIVREVHVTARGPTLLTRLETALLPAK